MQDLNDPNPLHHTALTGNLDVVMGSGKDTFNAQRVKANQVNFDEPGKTTAGGDTVSFYQVQAGSSNILTGPAADSVTLVFRES